MEEQLLAAIQENTAVMRELLQIEREKMTQSDWMTPEEAARFLKLKTSTPTKYHRRQLSRAADRYGIRVTGGKSPKYWRADIIEFNRKLLDGSAVI